MLYWLSLLSLSQALQLPFNGFDVEIIEINDPAAELMYADVEPVLNYALVNRNEVKVAEKIEKGVVVAIICDRGDRYLSSTLFEK